MNIIPRSVWRITRSAFLLTFPFYAVLTVVNFMRFMPKGIHVKTFGLTGSYATNVEELFSNSQNMILPLSVLVATIIVSVAHVSGSSEE